ncbi:hypothetical protein HFO45_06845 [Rhizobium leguminosarum]|nr:hypothetical protein [Rhizobium leguminosarum]
MDAEREFELACEMRFTAPCKPTPTYYIDPNQFKGDEAFADGVDVPMECESTARGIASASPASPARTSASTFAAKARTTTSSL